MVSTCRARDVRQTRSEYGWALLRRHLIGYGRYVKKTLGGRARPGANVFHQSDRKILMTQGNSIRVGIVKGSESDWPKIKSAMRR